MGSKVLFVLILGMGVWLIKRGIYALKRLRRKLYYRKVYLKSKAWQKKRLAVLKRDRWACVKCGKRATEVHHLRYARRIGREPLNWLIAICRTCHLNIHH